MSSVYLIADDIDAIYDPIITPIYTGRMLFCSVMTDDIDKNPCDPESRHIVYSTNVIDTIQGVMSFWIHFDTINLEPNYNMAYKAQQKLMLVDGIPLAQQPYNMGNMLWGLKMHRLGFSLPECLFGAHAYTIFGGLTGKYSKIELDSFDDQCSIILGFMLWPGF